MDVTKAANSELPVQGDKASGKKKAVDNLVKKALSEKVAKDPSTAPMDRFTKNSLAFKAMNEADEKMIQEFIKNLTEKTGLRGKDILAALHSLSARDLKKNPQGTVEEVFKHIDLPLAKKIGAIRLYEEFIRGRSSEIKNQLSLQNKERIASGELRLAVLKEDSSELRPNNSSTVDMGLALYRAQKIERS